MGRKKEIYKGLACMDISTTDGHKTLGRRGGVRACDRARGGWGKVRGKKKGDIYTITCDSLNNKNI